MIIRQANDNDIPGILKVLLASLGEVSSKKTAEVWQYKHIDNPFGGSLVLVAEEKGEIIGVRAFMRWQWQRGEEKFSAFRAVDTATHPDHQGKGIFKQLTMRALEIGKDHKDHFVFNTPNEQSRPGYLKMGWQEVSKLKVSLMPVFSFPGKGSIADNEYPVDFDAVAVKELLDGNHRKLKADGKLFTPKNTEFLKWRYLNNPLQSYRVYGDGRIFLAAYPKQQKYLRELRISEMVYANKYEKKKLRKLIGEWAREYKANFISFHSPSNHSLAPLELNGAFGPILTFRDLNTADSSYLKLNTWAYSLGDLELF